MGLKLGALLGDLLRSLFRRPATERYPHERREVPDQLPGRLHWDPSKCIGCCLCTKDCPAKAIELVTLDKAQKRFVLRYHADRCVFCAQCVQSCRFKCLAMSTREWELAAGSKEPFTIYYGDERDIEAVLDKQAAPGADPSANG